MTALAVPAVMQAVLLTGFGGHDRLEIRRDVPLPQPGPDEVLIKVGAAAVNNTDINTRIGWYSKAVEAPTDAGGEAGFSEARDDGWSGSAFSFPRIQGADAAGQIVSVGAGVPESRVGERVLVEPVFRTSGFDVRYFGSECDGAFADYAIVPARHAHAIKTVLTDIELASFPCSYSAAENMLSRARVSSGDAVLVTGASGGVGSAAVQLARRRGAVVTAIAAASKHDMVRSLGAKAVLDRGADLGTDRFDVVIDIVGGEAFPSLLQALRPGGRYATAGAIAGPMVELDLRTLYLKDLTFFGCTVLDPEVFPNLVRYIEQGEITPLVSATYRLSEIVAAQQAFLEKRHFGKIVLVP